MRANYMHACVVKGPPAGPAGRARLEEIMRTDARRRSRSDGGDEYIYRDGPFMNSIDLGGVPERRLREIWETNDIRQVDVDAEGATYTYLLRERTGR